YLEAWFNKAVSLHNLEKPQAALTAYSKSIELNPNYAEAYFNRAGLFLFLNELEKAKSDLEKAIALDPSYKQVALSDIALQSLIS
ncbi:MAG: tetratricopeptide repeat protein, partial [Thermodesulfobacteriota bacterium]